MEVHVQFLGPARDLAGVHGVVFDVSGAATAASVRTLIAAKFPRIIRALPTMRLAVNQSFVTDDHVLCAGDEVALIPPVSGG